MRDQITNLYVYSAFRPERSDAENHDLHAKELVFLRQVGIPFEEVKGVYQGQVELSILVEMPFNIEGLLLQRAEILSQECILRIHPDKTAELKYPNGKNTLIGKWTQVEKPVGDYTATKKGFFQAI